MYNGEVVACKEIDLEESEEMQEVPSMPLPAMLAAATAAAARHTGCMELPTTAIAHSQPDLATCRQLYQLLKPAHLALNHFLCTALPGHAGLCHRGDATAGAAASQRHRCVDVADQGRSLRQVPRPFAVSAPLFLFWCIAGGRRVCNRPSLRLQASMASA